MRYLVLPVLVVAALLLAVGHEMTSAIYAYVMGVCRYYLIQQSLWELVASIMGALTLTGVGAGLAVLTKELRHLRSLSRTLAVSVTHPLIVDGAASPSAELVEDGTPFAFCLGLRHPRIYVSRSLAEILTPSELRAVLLHEQAHARRRDPARVLAARVLAAAYFALPMMRLVRDRYLARLEVQADRETVAQVGAQPLTAALLKLLSSASNEQEGAAVAAFNVTEERIRRLATGGYEEGAVPLASPRTVAATGALLAGVGVVTSLGIGAVSAFLANATFCPIQVA